MLEPGAGIIIGTFADVQNANLAAHAARHAGFRAARRSLVGWWPSRPATARDTRKRSARCWRRTALGNTPDAATPLSSARVLKMAPAGSWSKSSSSLALNPVRTGEVTISKEILSETHTLEVPVRRET